MHTIFVSILIFTIEKCFSQPIWTQQYYDSHNSHCISYNSPRTTFSFNISTISFHSLNPNIVVNPHDNQIYIPVTTKTNRQSSLLIVSAIDGALIKNVVLDNPNMRVSGVPLVTKIKDKILYIIAGYPDIQRMDVTGVFATDLITGKRDWSVLDNVNDTSMNIYNMALSKDLILFQHNGLQTKNFLAANLKSKLLWNRYCEIDSPMTVGNNGYFYVLHSALDIKKIGNDGKDINTWNLSDQDWATFQDRKIAVNMKNGDIYVPATDNSFAVHVVAFSESKNSSLWSSLLDRTPYAGFTFSSDPVVNSNGDTVFVVSTDENGKGAIFHAFDTVSGTEKVRLLLPNDSLSCSRIVSSCDERQTYVIVSCKNIFHLISEQGKLVKSISLPFEYYDAVLDSSNNIFICGNLENYITGTLKCYKIAL